MVLAQRVVVAEVPLVRQAEIVDGLSVRLRRLGLIARDLRQERQQQAAAAVSIGDVSECTSGHPAQVG